MDLLKRAGSPLDREEQKRLAPSPTTPTTDLNVSLEGVASAPDGAGVAPGSTSGPASEDERLRRQLVAALSDREVLSSLAKVITDPLKAEIAHLRAELSACKDELNTKTMLIDSLEERLDMKDTQIEKLEWKVDDLEQYSRRNLIRVNGYPEVDGESTDEIVKGIAKVIGVDLELDDIDRSHRVGRRIGDDGKKLDRSIIVKFTSYRQKRKLMKDRKKLKNADFSSLFPQTAGNTTDSQQQREKVNLKVFLNDDLTKQRARVAEKARTLKKNKVITDTWVSDGAIIVKAANGDTRRVTSLKGLLELTN